MSDHVPTAFVDAARIIENERENFRNLFRQTPEMVCILAGPEHTFEFVNESHIRVLGFDATGKTVRNAQPESVEVHGLLDEVYRSGVTAQLHEIPVTVTDRLRYFNLTYAARYDENKNISGVMVLGAEVTEQVLARRALEASQKRFRDLANVTPTLVFIIDAAGKPSYFNQNWYDYTGIDPNADPNSATVVHAEDYPRW